MKYWYDTRENINRFPIYGWIFPCFFCCQPTNKDTVIKKNKIYKYINIPCCDLCKNKKFNLNYIDDNFIIDENQKKIKEKKELKNRKYKKYKY